MKGRVALHAVVAAAAGWYGVFIARTAFVVHGVTHFTLFDDAMVSMRYARNLADGHGLVWNTTGPRVEGFTNPLWTLWMAFLHLLPVPEAKVSLLVMISSAAILLANLYVVHALGRTLGLSNGAAIAAVVLTAACYPLVFWSLRGMEVGLLALLVDVAALLALRMRDRPPSRAELVRFALVCGLGVSVRMDALVAVLVVAAFAWRFARSRRVLVAGVGSALGTTLVLTLARRAYYGELLPNTYYLKATGVAMTQRLRTGFGALAHQLPGLSPTSTWIFAAGFAIVALTIRRHELATAGGLLATLVVGQMAYSVFVGGDAWEGMGYANRYLAVAAPALFLLAAAGIETLAASAARERRSFGPIAVVAVTLVVALAANGAAMRTWFHDNANLADADAYGASLGICERAATQRDVRVAVFLAGNGPYFSHRTSIDMLGKSDAHIARLPVPRSVHYRPGHNKSDLDYSVGKLHPDLVEASNFAWMGRVTPLTIYAFARMGYALTPNGLAVRNGSRAVDSAAIAAIVRERNGLRRAC